MAKHRENIYDVVIIGGGPAGLTAGLYVARERLKACLIESQTLPSQLLFASAIENYPGLSQRISGPELLKELKAQVKSFGLDFKTADVERVKRKENGIWQVVAKEETIDSCSLIIATGAKPKRLNLPQEEEFIGRGVSYCAICDGPLFKEEEIVVVGGGNKAVEEALLLAKFAKRVFLIHRRSRLKATEVLQERANSNKKIELLLDKAVVEILGRERVEGVVVEELKTQTRKIIPCSGVFVCIGVVPNTDFLKGTVKLNEAGYIITDSQMKTSEIGIFACGDCREKSLYQIVTACSDGAICAFSASLYVKSLPFIC